MLPRHAGARASWNFLRPATTSGVDAGRRGLTVTYDLTRLQRLATDTHYLVTLGGEDLVDPDSVIARMEYAHPIYTPESVAAQRALPEANTARIAFAGAYHGWGFHEDGARSGAAAAAHLGLPWDGARAAAARDVRRRASGTRDVGRSAGPSSTTPTRGWSTSTRCPTTACSARSRRATTSARPGRHCARTSTRS